MGAAHRDLPSAGAPSCWPKGGWVFKAHMFLGMSIFLIFPFTRLVHVWSGFGTVGYLVRPHQVVRCAAPERPGRTQPAAAPARASEESTWPIRQ
jgi:nitrate reductase gamma subunit